jgi:ribosomal protein L29
MDTKSSNISLIGLFNVEADFDEVLRQYNKEYANCRVLLENVNSKNYSATREDVEKSIANLNILNEKLINLNQKITLQTNSLHLNNLTNDNKYKLDNVISMYGTLLREQSEIQQLRKDYATINTENLAQTRNLDHQYAQYLFWSIVSLIVVFLLCRLLFLPDLPLNSFKFFFWVIVLSLLTISLLYSYISTGFLILCLIIGYIFLGLMKILPMP